MTLFWIITAAAALLAAVAVLICYICYRMAFYVPPRKPVSSEEISIPKGKIYEPYRQLMEDWTRQTRQMSFEELTITSFDGLTLYGKYYEYTPGAPIEIMFHGYRGTAERDLSGGVQRCFRLGRNALLVDQRCSGKSQGNTITFGIYEHRDCIGWVHKVIDRFGPDVKIILTGISMGASTVMIAAGQPLPDNVIGVLADCGFNSARDIIQKVIKKMGLPPRLAYPFVKWGARLFGHFDLEETSSEEALKSCRIPVIFFHGEADNFVPCSMSHINYAACAGKKRLVTVPGAGHGLCCLVDRQRYLSELEAFFPNEASTNPQHQNSF